MKGNRCGKELFRKDVFFGTELHCETKNKTILYSADIGKFANPVAKTKIAKIQEPLLHEAALLLFFISSVPDPHKRKSAILYNTRAFQDGSEAVKLDKQRRSAIHTGMRVVGI